MAFGKHASGRERGKLTRCGQEKWGLRGHQLAGVAAAEKKPTDVDLYEFSNDDTLNSSMGLIGSIIYIYWVVRYYGRTGGHKRDGFFGCSSP